MAATKHEVPEGNLSWLRARIEHLARRAKRLGLTISMVVEPGTRVEKDPDGSVTCWRTVVVEGERPLLPGGWTFWGVVRHTEDGNLVLSVAGDALPVEFRTAAPTCDHCHTARRRNDTFVVRSEAGEIRRVGRQCLADFLGTGAEDRKRHV